MRIDVSGTFLIRDPRKRCGLRGRVRDGLRAGEVSRLYPHLGAVQRRLDGDCLPGRKPKPGLRLENLPSCAEASIQNDDLDATWIAECDFGAWHPALQSDVFMVVAKERHDLGARPARGGCEHHLARVDAHLGPVVRIELPELD